MKKITTILLGLGIITGCGNNSKDIENSFTGKCLVDYIDQNDGDTDGLLKAKWAEHRVITDIGKDILAFNLKPASFYAESNHLYVMDGACPDIATFANPELIENLEPSAIYTLNADDVETTKAPNDPLYENQWNFEQVDAELAWKNSKQGEGVIVAVIDTGVAYKDHDKGNALEDMNKTKFTKGVSFTRDGLPDGLDDHAHGSHVAGTIAQSTNNDLGVAGLAPKATIMPLKVLSSWGGGTTEDIASAIRYAADNGAKVINMSLGGPYPSKIMEDAVNYAHEKGVVVVCAAGNERSSKVGYPAGYEKCLSVSATDKNKGRAWYSNYGKGVDIAAPGGDTRNHPYDGVLQNTINPKNIKEQGYYGFQGTSMASPHVAGVAALVIGEGVNDNEKVWEILQESAVHPKDVERDDDYGHGIVNANNAVLMAKGENDGDLSWTKYALIGVVLLALFGFVAFQGWKNMRGIEDDHDKYGEDEDENEY